MPDLFTEDLSKVIMRDSADIPEIFSLIPWIRKSSLVHWVDCEEDLSFINRMKSVCSGIESLSVFDSAFHYVIKAEFPTNWDSYSGKSEQPIRWRYYFWKTKDVINYIEGIKPVEAIQVEELRAFEERGKSVFSQNSYLKHLKLYSKLIEWPEIYDTNKDKIKSLELELKAKRIHFPRQIHKAQKSANTRLNQERLISTSFRLRLLNRDGYKCLLCGNDSQTSKLEIDHIIPLSTISKLHLSDELFQAESNLCTKCQDCNKGKSDHLFPRLVAEYIKRFSGEAHPNYKILPFLRGIKELQNLNMEING